ncbi:MAG: electron transport complex subunit RsxC [Bacteroidales bacterium]|jgi:electron transport complex protein RnfC|nr:electron transport complex subunit RsxC [Bacteroidales bacterium]MBQ1679582.1 electron transport complex subunit RsxC [Bacteroidales bacterium]MBQ1754609.1 electron transport complex subunit RsxC [Bacteroidales bacterium]MBQ1831420.1 electron transport complex subunit RsxC [Bacteroidales bacterium]MBQ2148957.1 electron transport complex subunit RsxC [Bacteroidales bacterium]
MKKTFRIGGVHPHDNKISAEAAIEVFPAIETAYVSMAQHLGAPATPVVAVGDKVLVGQVIAEPSGFISGYVHSPVSGTVKKIEPRADIAGNMVPHIEITVEGDEWMENIDRTPDIIREIPYTAEEIIAKVKNAGIVGLGGASFPTHVKLAPPKDKKAECLILNGTECEPYLTSDDRIMRERPEEILLGGVIMMKALGVTRGYVGIEENKPAAIASMTEAAKAYPQIEVVTLKKRYPQGGEKQLIDAVIRRQVPSGGLPIETGAVVQNVGTSLAVYEAVQKNKPLIDNVITVTGKCLPVQHNYKVRIGTPMSKILEVAGGVPEKAAKLISGGPMMGRAIANPDAATVKANGAILLLTEEETRRRPESNCIRCSKCASACPMGLEPWLLNKLGRAGLHAELEQERVYDCIECGCCSFTCPAGIPLLDVIRISKAEVMKIMRSRPKK